MDVRRNLFSDPHDRELEKSSSATCCSSRCLQTVGLFAASGAVAGGAFAGKAIAAAANLAAFSTWFTIGGAFTALSIVLVVAFWLCRRGERGHEMIASDAHSYHRAW